MTDTLISIISIFIGMLGAAVFVAIKKKYSLGLIGNTIAGIFGSILFIKVFGRIGFDPMSIMKTGEVNGFLFTVNMLVSFLGGVVGVVAVKRIKDRLK